MSDIATINIGIHKRDTFPREKMVILLESRVFYVFSYLSWRWLWKSSTARKPNFAGLSHDFFRSSLRLFYLLVFVSTTLVHLERPILNCISSILDVE